MRKGLALFAGMVLVALAAVAGTSAFARTSQAATRGPNRHHLRIILSPRVVVPYGWSTIEIVGAADASAVAVRLRGASGVTGQPMPWIPLRRDGDRWTSRLPQPVLAGIYPIEVRTRPASVAKPATAAYLRVYWPGTEALPSFTTPEQVAESWVHDTTGGTLDAIRPWPGTAIDHRLPALHRVFVIAYSPPGQPAAADRLGAFVTAVRDGFNGPWRLLEASVSPP